MIRVLLIFAVIVGFTSLIMLAAWASSKLAERRDLNVPDVHQHLNFRLPPEKGDDDDDS